MYGFSATRMARKFNYSSDLFIVLFAKKLYKSNEI